MGLIIFWSVLALLFLVLAIVTGKALSSLNKKLKGLKERGTLGILDENGNPVDVPLALYQALKNILITDVFGFALTTAAAIASAIYTTK